MERKNSNRTYGAYFKGVYSIICFLHASVQMTKLEEELFDSVEVGDVAGVLRLFTSHTELDADATDGLGRTPLNLATSNEHEEVKSMVLSTYE